MILHKHQEFAAEFRHPKILLVGNPNVGKSVIFNLLTGKYAVVSNYPGTTVEVSLGNAVFGGRVFTVLDTPGISNLSGTTEDEKVTRDILLEEPDAVVVQVIDAKNLTRGLALTAYLGELGFRMVIVLNMTDEAEDRGIYIDHRMLSEKTGVPVVPMIATERKGLHQLRDAILEPGVAKSWIKYSEETKQILEGISRLLPEKPFHREGLALLLAGSGACLEICARIPGCEAHSIEAVVAEFRKQEKSPIAFLIARNLTDSAEELFNSVATSGLRRAAGLLETLGRLSVHRVYGAVIAVIILFIMFEFVGVLGARYLVDFFENGLFNRFVNPFFTRLLEFFPALLRDMFVGRYGIISMAVTYGLAIVLPITATFFLFFAFLEDCGYLPRLAFLLDRMMKPLGLTGKAVLPLTLGLGCCTMATLTTRILETRKEKLIATILLTLAIPCSAQLGVVLGILGSISGRALVTWLITIVTVMACTGIILNSFIKGNPVFAMELPPLRLPDARNILVKTGRRVEWYLKEALPLFVIGTFILFVLDETGLLGLLIKTVAPLNRLLDLPDQMSEVFVMGFLRRDYGAAGMYALFQQGILSSRQTVVAAVVITLFVPCIAQTFITIRERGGKVAGLAFASVFCIAYIVGFLVNNILKILGIF